VRGDIARRLYDPPFNGSRQLDDAGPVRLHLRRQAVTYTYFRHHIAIMTSYYGDRPRDIPSWDSLDGGDDDDLIRSEVGSVSLSKLMSSINMLVETISYSA
jgi:hypothetical protein